MSDAPVLYDVNDSIGQITLNRPLSRNSMDNELLPAFQETIGSVIRDRSLRCLIISGTGENFCSGVDFRSDLLDDRGRLPNETFMAVYRPFLAILDIEVPTIAAMNGHAIGGGLGLALVCDLRVANKAAKYGANFARLGVHSGMAMSYILPRLVGLPVASELLLTGRLINGGMAAEMGMVNYAVEPDRVLEKALELAREIASCAPVAVRMMKRSIYRGLDWDVRNAAELDSHFQSRTYKMEDAEEGIRALLERRKPVFRGR